MNFLPWSHIQTHISFYMQYIQWDLEQSYWVRVYKAMYDTVLKLRKKKRYPVLKWFLWRCTTIQNKLLMTGCLIKKKKIKFCEKHGCCTDIHCVAALEVSMLLTLALIGGRIKHEDAVKIIGHKHHEAFNIKQLYM